VSYLLEEQSWSLFVFSCFFPSGKPFPPPCPTSFLFPLFGSLLKLCRVSSRPILVPPARNRFPRRLSPSLPVAPVCRQASSTIPCLLRPRNGRSCRPFLAIRQSSVRPCTMLRHITRSVPVRPVCLSSSLGHRFFFHRPRRFQAAECNACSLFAFTPVPLSHPCSRDHPVYA